MMRRLGLPGRGFWVVAAFGLGMAWVRAQQVPAANGPEGRSDGGMVFQFEFKNVQLQPPHWLLEFDASGAGKFDSEGVAAPAQDTQQIKVGDVHRPVQVSKQLATRAFAVARARKLFAVVCDGHLKVAYQGTKRFTYRGPDGAGSCEYNYSKDKELQALGDSLLAVENTILTGERLEKLLQHDRLGLDQELERLGSSAHDGTAQELGTIRETLTKIALDEQVMDRARRKARGLLAETGE